MDTGRGEAGEGGFYRMGARRPGPRQRAPQCYPRRTGFSRGLLTWPLPLRRQGEAGRGCPRFALIPKTPLPNPPLPSKGREQKLAAEAAPAGVRGQSQGELEIVDQAGAAQPRGDEGDAPTRAVFRLVQVTISHDRIVDRERSEEHTSELQSLMSTSYAVFCLKKKKNTNNKTQH